eukprot:TRINITY_DN8648_c0_g1_i1.p1 TRINITY_DN8648_c0_g1~~TRINITY_DN8648_c0_g1_i1.p1  ORF type:complete len:199 (-),score=76.51 TRINITY_DN8648_c0_g1_i1:279-875(-)
MVAGVVVHGTGRGAHVLLSRFFSPEGNDRTRMERSAAIAALVCEELEMLRVSAAIGPIRPDEPSTASQSSFAYIQQKPEKASMPKTGDGARSLAAGELFRTEKVLVWHYEANTCFTLVCERDESRLRAKNVLELLCCVIQQHTKNPNVLKNPEELLQAPEEMYAMLDKFLPCGELLLMSTPYARQLKRELDDSLSARS